MIRTHLTKLLLAGAAALMATGAFAEGIGASLLTQQHPFYISLASAMTAEAKAENLPLEIAIANQDLNKQLADVEDFITKGVSVIIISPVDSTGVKSAIAKAQKAGIKVITVDVPAKGVEVTSHVGTDNYTGGVKAGELMAKQIGDKGNVAVIDYPTVQSVVDRVEGFKRRLLRIPISRSSPSRPASPGPRRLPPPRTSCRLTPMSSASSASVTMRRLLLPRPSSRQSFRTRSRSSASTAWKKPAMRSRTIRSWSA